MSRHVINELASKDLNEWGERYGVSLFHAPAVIASI